MDIPKGYVLVPIEPTNYMIGVGAKAHYKNGGPAEVNPAAIYKAMIEAAKASTPADTKTSNS